MAFPFDELVNSIDKISLIGPFLRTKSAVRRGCNIYDYSNEKLDKNGYQRPLLFNVSESLLATLPFSIFTSISELISPSSGTAEERLLELAWPALIPFVFLTTAYAGAIFSLKNEERESTKIKRATRAYLYFQGAYGFTLEIILTIYAGLYNLKYLDNFVIHILIYTYYLIIFVEFVQNNLFYINGYIWNFHKDMQPPYISFAIAHMIVIPLLIIIFLLLFALSISVLIFVLGGYHEAS